MIITMLSFKSITPPKKRSQKEIDQNINNDYLYRMG